MKVKVLSLVISVFAMVFVSTAQAGPKEKAIRLHRIITGVQPSPAMATEMSGMISAGDIKGAARKAMESRYFYDVTLKNWMAAWTNEQVTPVVDLNDAIATGIGIVRDDLDFRQILTGDIIYVADPQIVSNAYSKIPQEAQRHYSDLQESNEPLQTALIRRTQSEMTGLPASSVAGIVTSQAWGEAFFKAGTNRRVWNYLMVNFQCTELEGMMDTSIPGVRIRRDVDRAPGGEPSVFKNKCIGCHGLMDAAGGAMAFYNYIDDNNDPELNGQPLGLQYRPGYVWNKMNRLPDTFPSGYVTTGESWQYLGGLSAGTSLNKIGWRGPASGSGLNSLTKAIADSRGFSECISKKVFKKVCLRTAGVNDKGLIRELANGFEKDGKYNVKDLIAATSEHCLDE